jgi:archaellum biogenesis protein FlaJ (TadC family)
MRQDTKWYVIPRTAAMCWLTLAVGVLLLVVTVPRMTDGVAILPMISVLAAVALVVFGVVGLVSPRLRGR